MENGMWAFIVKLKLYDDVLRNATNHDSDGTVKCLRIRPMADRAAKTSAETDQSERRMQIKEFASARAECQLVKDGVLELRGRQAGHG